MEKPLVSVIILTYNQEKYISEALDSVLCQKTTFPFEVLIGDDASSDSTPQLIKQYAKKYPDIITPILRKENIGANPNYVDLVKRCKGDYLAFLDGDDSWCNEKKLQIHVDFLNQHPEYIGISGWCHFIDHKGNTVWYAQGDHYALFPRHNFYPEDYMDGRIPGQGGTTLVHNVYKDLDFEWEKLYEIDPLIGDQISYFIYMLSGKKFYVTHKYFSNYRFISSTTSGNYTSTFGTKKDTTLFFYRYFNALEKNYYNLTGKKVNLRPRKFKYVCFNYTALRLHFNKSNLMNILTILKEEPHPILLLWDGIKSQLRIQKRNKKATKKN